MGIQYPDASEMRRLFTPASNGTAQLAEGPLVIDLSGLKTLPDGSEYFLLLVATPVRTKQESHQQ